VTNVIQMKSSGQDRFNVHLTLVVEGGELSDADADALCRRAGYFGGRIVSDRKNLDGTRSVRVAAYKD
jgi:hypothetical protein